MKTKITKSHWLMFTLFLTLFSSACKDQDDCCVIIETAVQISYVNDQGENLLNSSTEFDESKIRIYYKKEDSFEYAYDGNLDAPNMYSIYYDQDSMQLLKVFPSNHYDGNFSTTLIEFNETTVDTLYCEFELGDSKEICIGAWLNGVEMPDRFLTVVK